MREPSPLDDADWLRQRYEVERLSSPAIAGMLDTTPGRVIRALRQHGIPVRSGKDIWNDSEYRQALTEKRRQQWTPERRARRSEQMKGDPTGQLARGRERLKTDDARAKMREATRRSWENPEARANRIAGMALPEVRRRMSEKRSAYWAAHPDEQQQSLARMRSKIKGGHYLFSLEARVAMALNAAEAWYRLHALIGPYAADFLVQPDLVVECDGTYWHGQRPDHDAARDAYMTEHGYRVVRIPEQATQDEIEAILREHAGSHAAHPTGRA